MRSLLCWACAHCEPPGMSDLPHHQPYYGPSIGRSPPPSHTRYLRPNDTRPIATTSAPSYDFPWFVERLGSSPAHSPKFHCHSVTQLFSTVSQDNAQTPHRNSQFSVPDEHVFRILTQTLTQILTHTLTHTVHAVTPLNCTLRPIRHP